MAECMGVGSCVVLWVECAWEGRSALPARRRLGSRGTSSYLVAWMHAIVNALHALMDALQDVFYVSGQVGVVYDRTSNEQHLLQGHRHAIVASAVRCVRACLYLRSSCTDKLIATLCLVIGLPYDFMPASQSVC